MSLMATGSPVASREDKQRAFEAVLKSRTFARSDQLQLFLRYICEAEVAGRGDEITEYSIATSALNRRPDYAPGEDSSVRSRAHSLRRKLHEFYETESPDAELRIELPKGSYRPVFVARSKAETATNSSEAPKKSGLPLRTLLLGAAFTAIVALLAVGLAGQFKAGPIDPVVREAWGPALEPSSDVLIVLSCPPVARTISSQPGVPPQTTNATVAPAIIAEWYNAQKLEDHGGPVYVFPSRGYTTFSDMLATTQVTTLLSSAGTSYQAIPEPAVRPSAVHERGLVLIGSPTYTTFLARLLRITPLSIRYDPARNEEVISDGPAGTARNVFAAKRNTATNRFSTVYGLITVLPSQPGRERPQRTLIFSGIMGSPGAQAAVQFFTSPVAMRDLKERFRRDGHAEFPPAYQVVVRCGVDAEAAMNSVYETHRVMSSTPIIE